MFTNTPRLTRVSPHKIELTSKNPVRVRSYPVPLHLMNPVKQELEAIESAGVIEKSTSPYCNPMVITCKKDGKVRICGDFRKLNAITKFIEEPMSDHNVIFSRLAESKYFMKLDLTKGYFQMPLDPESQKITAFSTPWGLYQYKVLPFRLVNFPVVFNRTMRYMLKDMEGVEVFVDDILVHTATLPEHLVTGQSFLSSPSRQYDDQTQ